MDLVTPSIGLIFWTTLVFVILLILLSKFAWKPILSAVKSREESINNALESAERIKAEMATMKSENEKLLQEARLERDKILKEAKETKDNVIAEAQRQAKDEAAKIFEKVNLEIKREKEQAFKELKSEVAQIAIQVATKILKSELADSAKQETLVAEYLKEAKFN